MDAVAPAGSTNDNERVYEALRRGIVEGRFAPGTRLVEQRLADAYDVSRTPVREAVRRLESEGLVVVARNRGAQVRPLEEAEIADLYGARARLEGYAAELAAARATPQDLAAVADALGRFDAAVAAAPVAAAGEGERLAGVRALEAANAAFHGAVIDASHHARLRVLVGGVVDAPLVFRALQRFDTAELARSAEFHRLVGEAVASGEADRAGRLMVEHVLQGRDVLLQRLSDAGGVSNLFGQVGA